jgi:hypothetical protein
MQNNDRPASPVIEQPTHDHPRSLAAKVQPRRLTDSHRRGSNRRRGFELMKKGGACSGSKQNDRAHWRDVNPARAVVSTLIIRDARGDFAARSVSRRQKCAENA